MKPRTGIVIVLGVGAAVALLGLGAVAGARLTRDCSFSPETWAAGREPVNFEMLEHDLRLAVGCGTLDGASPARVQRLLGRPDRTTGSLWSYDVGVPRMLSDYPDFDVRFGSGGRVEDARVPGYIEPGILASLGVE